MVDAFLEAGLWISYMNTFATGEGVTSCLAIGYSQAHAERVLKSHLAEYYHGAIVTECLSPECSEDVKAMLVWVPHEARRVLRRLPAFAGEYYTELHYNLS